MAAEAPRQYVPLTCHGHSRPVPHIGFSHLEKEETYYMVSACKGVLRSKRKPSTVADMKQMETPCFATVSPVTGTAALPLPYFEACR